MLNTGGPAVQKMILSLALTLAAGAAHAADFVVVKSTDPAIRPGVALDGGQRVALGDGQTLTLMASGGDMMMLRGGPAGAMAPARKAASIDANKLDTLRALIEPPPVGRAIGGRRGGVCPDAATLKTLDDILAVQQAGCGPEAREALDALAAGANASATAH